MPQAKNAMEIFKLLDMSNCRECGEKTCLAFAGAVFQGHKKLAECPKLDPEIIQRYSVKPAKQDAVEQNRDEYLKQLKSEIANHNLAAAAERVDAKFSGNRLTLKVLGKDFGVDTAGNLYADIHINPWVVIPFLSYLLHGNGLPVSGNWVSFRGVADIYTNLFDDLVHLFSGKKVAQQFESDISVVLHPLPKVPIMICYWMPEDGLESSLNVFFDQTADENLDIGSVFTLGAGLAQMFGKLALRHGFPEAVSSS
jgi:hypothetical protein